MTTILYAVKSHVMNEEENEYFPRSGKHESTSHRLSVPWPGEILEIRQNDVQYIFVSIERKNIRKEIEGIK